MSAISILIPAAGSSSRMGGSIKKQYLMCEDLPVLIKTVKAFCHIKGEPDILVIAPAEDISFVRDMLNSSGLETVKVIEGGPTRQHSVFNGLKALSPDTRLVLIHDGARPFVSQRVIDDVIASLEEGAKAVIPAVRPKNTVRTAEKTLDRSLLYEVQTPQGFDFAALMQAYEKAFADGFAGTDDASLVERLGIPVTITGGDYANIKITTREDLPMIVRIGTGYDVHRLTGGRPLMLGCIEVPYEKGLLGHSDADVIAHAIADAILGACALGDIGKLFPDNAKETEGMSGSVLLSQTARFIRENGFTISNVDATLIAEKPKISPYTESMREAVAASLGISVKSVSIKATTEEKLGFTGDGSAMACQAVCTVLGR